MSVKLSKINTEKIFVIQDCIPVGCVLPARWPYLSTYSALGGGCFPGVCFPGGVLPGGCVLTRGDVLPRGCFRGEGCASWGGYPSMHWGRPPPLWTEWQPGAKILSCPKLYHPKVSTTDLKINLISKLYCVISLQVWLMLQKPLCGNQINLSSLRWLTTVALSITYQLVNKLPLRFV